MNIAYKYSGEIEEATFIQRLNRFVAKVAIKEQVEEVHVKNTGRMEELLLPGRKCWLEKVDKPHRKTLYDLICIEHEGLLVNLDSLLPNKLAEQILRAGLATGGKKPEDLHKEVSIGQSRLDFVLGQGSGKQLYVEVKGVNLVTGEGLALFPDAQTSRGRKHVEEIQALTEAGEEGLILFIVQREDASYLMAHKERDPAFALALKKAKEAGVALKAFKTQVQPGEVSLCKEIPVLVE